MKAEAGDFGDPAEMERRARAELPPAVYDYFAGGAGREITLADNTAAWTRWRLWPRTLAGVGHVSTRVRIGGLDLEAPVLVAPMGYQALAHPEGEVAMAVGARASGLGMIVSTYATTTIEDVVASRGGGCWFQTYWLRDEGLSRDLIRRAVAAGCRAIVLTVDAPVVGDRRRDRRYGHELPADGITLANFEGERSRLASTYSTDLDPTIGPDTIGQVAEAAAGVPVYVKGVVRPDDAVRCLRAGAAGVVVSNHGGRQLDGVVATADALPAVADAVGDDGDILVDGGIRCGEDVLRALALGADAVLVGRPALWALTLGGADGVAAHGNALREQLRTAMWLAGVADVGSISRDLVDPRPSVDPLRG